MKKYDVNFDFWFSIVVIVLFFIGLEVGDSYNRSSIKIVDQNVIVTDKYHKSEDCTYYDTQLICDDEEFRVKFDNNVIINLKNKDNWLNVHEGQLWHYHAIQGRLWTISEEAYKL